MARYRATKERELISAERDDFELRMDEYFMYRIEVLESKVVNLIESLDTARSEHDALAERVTEIESGKLITKEHHQKYLDSVRQ